VATELVNLPEDSGALKAMVRSLALERDRERQRAEELRVEMLRLQLELERFRKWYYGPAASWPRCCLPSPRKRTASPFIPKIFHPRLSRPMNHGGCGGARIEAAAKPEAPVDKGLAGPGLLAYIVTSKFCDYLPLYRLGDTFERQGV